MKNGGEFKYHYNDPDKGAFIVDQAEAVAGINYINLTEIPKNNYKKVRIGLGISQTAYLIGQDGQGRFSGRKLKRQEWLGLGLQDIYLQNLKVSMELLQQRMSL